MCEHACRCGLVREGEDGERELKLRWGESYINHNILSWVANITGDAAVHLAQQVNNFMPTNKSAQINALLFRVALLD